jgi:hypothetical protein
MKFKPGLPHRTGCKITTSTILSPSSTQKWYIPLNSKIPTHYISPTVIFPNYIQLIFQNGIFIIQFQLIQHFHRTMKKILMKKVCLKSSFTRVVSVVICHAWWGKARHLLIQAGCSVPFQRVNFSFHSMCAACAVLPWCVAGSLGDYLYLNCNASVIFISDVFTHIHETAKNQRFHIFYTSHCPLVAGQS